MGNLNEGLKSLARDIWDHPEIRFKEFYSSKVQQEFLADQGFNIKKGLAGMPTAFEASWGEGPISVGFLGEFDALAGLSQKADCFHQDPLLEGGLGHGCGHNLLGVGSLGAAIQLKEYLEEAGSQAKISYFACPGEEGGSGKAFMAKAGIFDGLDFALSWHPGTFNAVASVSLLANKQVYVRFHGTPAHAAASPQLGRSALDGLNFVNLGVEFLREHMEPEARIHYAITDSGGMSPNVIPGFAEGLYLIRSGTTKKVDALYQRFEDIVEGAGLITGTQPEIIFDKACSNIVQNWVIESVLYEAYQEVGVAPYSQEDLKYARSYYDNYPKEYFLGGMLKDLASSPEEAQDLWDHQVLHEGILDYKQRNKLAMGSSDVGDVSNLVPTGQIVASTWPVGTPSHSWQAVAMGKSDMAMKGMIRAKDVLSLAGKKLIEDPSKIKKAKEELVRRRGKTFTSPIPDGAKPHIE